MKHNTLSPANSLLRIKQVLAILPISKSTLWEWVKRGKLPAPMKLGPRVTCWKADDIREFIERKNEEGGAL